MTTADNSSERERFELVERIAVGGMAEVFKAKSYGPGGFQKILAVKRILPELASKQEFVDRFIVEAKIAATLSHANIVQVVDFSRFGESLYIAMEYVDGVDLATLLRGYRKRDQQLPLPVAMHIAIGMLTGLGAAHRQGVVHRDVSPQNVLLSRSGDVKITDFGIAKAAAGRSGHTRPFNILGKWRYMSPEQARGDDLDSRSDVFSAALVLFELFAGRRLYDGDDLDAIDRQRGKEVPKLTSLRPELPEMLDGLMERALERDAAARTITCEEMVAALVDLAYEVSAPDAGLALAKLVVDFLADEDSDEDAEDSGGGYLIDQIINSELDRHRDKPAKRVTMASTSPSIAFVPSGEDENGITKWTLSDADGQSFDDVLETLMGASAGTVPVGAVRIGDTQPSVTALSQAGLRRETSEPVAVPRRQRYRMMLGMALLVAFAVLAFAVLQERQRRKQLEARAGQGGGGLVTDADAASGEALDASAAATTGPVRITSNPPGATIFVAGADTRLQTPSDVNVPEPRTDTPILVTLGGYLDCEMRAQTPPGARQSIAHCDMQKLEATLVVASEPSGAEVFLDDKRLGTTPLELAVPATGNKATLRISASGYDDEVEKVQLVAGDRLEVVRRLQSP